MQRDQGRTIGVEIVHAVHARVVACHGPACRDPLLHACVGQAILRDLIGPFQSRAADHTHGADEAAVVVWRAALAGEPRHDQHFERRGPGETASVVPTRIRLDEIGQIRHFQLRLLKNPLDADHGGGTAERCQVRHQSLDGRWSLHASGDPARHGRIVHRSEVMSIKSK